MTSEADARTRSWDIAGLRLTAFQLETPSSERLDEWWRQVAGELPERQLTLPQESRWEYQGSLNVAELSEAKLTLSAQRTRIDWVLQNRSEEQDLPTLGAFPAGLHSFAELVGDWLGTAQLTILRIALGVSLRQAVTDRQSGYQLLADYLPFPVNPEDTDFLYRVNKPRKSEALSDGTLINRLRTWAVIQVSTMLLSGTLGDTAEIIPSERSSFALQLELDINSAKERSDRIPHEQLVPLLRELVAVAVDIGQHGDRR